MSTPLFTIGFIADVQYADKPDGSDYCGMNKRYFRGALKCLQRAVDRWTSPASPKLNYVINLADLLDGSNKAMGKTDEALETLLSEFRRLPPDVDVHHLIGNHELMNFPKSELLRRGWGRGGRPYYSFTPHSGWRVLVLDSYGEHVIRPGADSPIPHGAPEYAAAREVLMENNPNLRGGEATWGSVDWAEGLNSSVRRYMPYNGAYGKAQIEWIRAQLEESSERGERVIICSHAPICPASANIQDLCFDYETVLQIVRDYSKTVAAVFAGHHHFGGYALDCNVHHLTLASPLETPPECPECAATVQVTSQSINVTGHGYVPSMKWDLA